MTQAPLRFFLAALLAVVFVGCDADSNPGPVSTGDSVAGRYVATTFEAFALDDADDLLAAGGSLTIDLRSDSTASGLLIVPDVLDEDGDGQYPFGGTYSVYGDVVRFDHEADTFIRDVDWTYDDGVLRAEESFVRIVLERE